MARKPALRWLRLGVLVASWMAAVSLAQALFDEDIGGAVRRLERQLEEQLEWRGAPPAQSQPAHSHETESFEPWELVDV